MEVCLEGRGGRNIVSGFGHARLQVPIIGDTAVEPDETAAVQLLNS